MDKGFLKRGLYGFIVSHEDSKTQRKLGAESGREIGVSGYQVAGHQENRTSED